MSAKTIIALLACIMLVSLSACSAPQLPNELPQDKTSETPQDTKGLRIMVQTRAGELALSYVNDTAILQGTLQRSTPCVDWQVDTDVTIESSPGSVRFSIEDKSTAEMCVQVLGEPQEVFASVRASPDARYMVLFRGEPVFEGNLQ